MQTKGLGRPKEFSFKLRAREYEEGEEEEHVSLKAWQVSVTARIWRIRARDRAGREPGVGGAVLKSGGEGQRRVGL